MNHQTHNPPDTQAHDFMLVEYKECSMAFFKGVDIGFLYIRLFFIINAALAAVYQFDEGLMKRLGGAGDFVPYLAPLLGILFCIILSLFVPYYRRQLDHCASRCADIEKNYGGQLFRNIFAENNDRRRPITATSGIYALTFIIGSLWLAAVPFVNRWILFIFGHS